MGSFTAWRRYFFCRKPRRSGPSGTGMSILPPSQNDPSPLSRCLLLGLSGSGKTTFLYRLKTGKFFDVQPTNGFHVEGISVGKRGPTMNFTEVANSDRRGLRLQFPHSLQLLATGILFFIDTTSPPPGVQEALEELAYVLTYTHAKGYRICYLGVVLNKQDLLVPAARPIATRVKKEVQETIRRFVSERKLEKPESLLLWEVLGDDPVSMKTGVGVDDVLERLVEGMDLKDDDSLREKNPTASNNKGA